MLAAIPAVKTTAAVRGQYGAGEVLGKKTKAYRQEPNVTAGSNVETYVAMRVEIDNWRWAGVPFYLRTGKHMARRNTEIAIRFKQAPYAAFQNTPVGTLRPNWLVLRIAPDEGISLQFEVKRRGPAMDLAAVKMDFHYDDWFPKEPNVGYRDADLRRHDWRSHIIHARRYGGADLAHRAAGGRRLGQGWRGRFVDLSSRKPWTKRSGRASSTRWPPLAQRPWR